MWDMADDCYDMVIDEMINESIELNILERVRKTWNHVTREWKVIKLKDMTIQHLVNTIKYFWYTEWSPYHKEIERRNSLSDINTNTITDVIPVCKICCEVGIKKDHVCEPWRLQRLDNEWK